MAPRVSRTWWRAACSTSGASGRPIASVTYSERAVIGLVIKSGSPHGTRAPISCPVSDLSDPRSRALGTETRSPPGPWAIDLPGPQPEPGHPEPGPHPEAAYE